VSALPVFNNLPLLVPQFGVLDCAARLGVIDDRTRLREWIASLNEA
jgi:hypothetical protein